MCEPRWMGIGKPIGDGRAGDGGPKPRGTGGGKRCLELVHRAVLGHVVQIKPGGFVVRSGETHVALGPPPFTCMYVRTLAPSPRCTLLRTFRPVLLISR